MSNDRLFAQLPAPFVGRSRTEDLVMHVKLDNDSGTANWHREVTAQITACERPVPTTGVARRLSRYDSSDGDYCAGCFSPYEIRLARATAAVDRELLEEDFDSSVADRRAMPAHNFSHSAGDLIDKSRRRSQRIAAHLIDSSSDHGKKDTTQ